MRFERTDRRVRKRKSRREGTMKAGGEREQGQESAGEAGKEAANDQR